MGTSKGYIAPTTPHWSTAKRAVTAFINNRDFDSKAKAASKYATAMKKDMSTMSNDIFSAKILEIQNEIKKLDAEVEQRSEKLAQAFMQYKDEKLSKENYMEMREERNNWKMFCEERKETLEQMIRRLQKQQKEETRFLRSLLDLEGTTRINAELAEALIESMYLYGDGRLEINFRFKGAIEHE